MPDDDLTEVPQSSDNLTTEITLMDPAYLKLLTDRFGSEDQRTGTLWNYFMYSVDYDPNEEVFVDAEGNIVDSKPMIPNPAYVPATGPTQEINPVWTAWNRLAPTSKDAKPEPEKYITTDGTPAQGEEFIEDPSVTLTKTTRGEIEGYDPSIVSESELIQMGIQSEAGLLPQRTKAEGAGLTADIATSGFNTAQANRATDLIEYGEERGLGEAEIDAQFAKAGFTKAEADDAKVALKERAPVRTAFYEQALEGLDTEKYARQGAADASYAYDASKEGLFRDLSRRGVNPGETMTDNSMERAALTSTAKTGARNWAEQESFNRLNTALNNTGTGV